MAYCSKCGAQMADGTRFCPSCGQPVSAVASGRMNQSFNRGYQNEREEAIAELGRMSEYFGQKQDLYDTYDSQTATIKSLQYRYTTAENNKKLQKLFGAIFFLAAFFFGPSSKDSGLSLGEKFSKYFGVLLVEAICVGLFFLDRKLKKQKLESLADEISKASAAREITASKLLEHYNGYGYCPVGAELTNPRVLASIYEPLRQGRTTTIAGAINLLLDDDHKRTMESYAADTVAYSQSAASSAKTAAFFAAADFFANHA